MFAMSAMPAKKVGDPYLPMSSGPESALAQPLTLTWHEGTLVVEEMSGGR